MLVKGATDIRVNREDNNNTQINQIFMDTARFQPYCSHHLLSYLLFATKEALSVAVFLFITGPTLAEKNAVAKACYTKIITFNNIRTAVVDISLSNTLKICCPYKQSLTGVCYTPVAA